MLKKYSRSDIETDGRRIQVKRDPPGQKCIYIAPGDTARETYRLSTFHHFPRDSPIDPFLFSSSGFYYTGYRDRVKCFSCGRCSENWLPLDDVTSAEWHDADCDFINGRDESNVPILSLVPSRQSNRNLPSFQCDEVSHATANRSSSALPSSSSRGNDATAMATPHSPSRSGGVNGVTAATSSISNSLSTARPINSPKTTVNGAHVLGAENCEEQENMARMFPCLHPINPHMRARESRLQTFLDHMSSWPAHRISATPQEIAEAGMYFLGERDRVKCWYCNGGLQNWEREDSPWEEHAKWFPLCEYLLQQKGPRYVQNIVEGNPNLRRPTLRNPSTSPSVRTLASRVGQDINRAPELPNQSTQRPVIVDPKEEKAKRTRMVKEEMKCSKLVSQARTLGFDDGAIERALDRKYQTDQRNFETMDEFIGSILSITEEDEDDDEAPMEVSNEQTSTSAAPTSVSEMRKLEKLHKCRICGKEDACMVFIPCGHLVCCLHCGEKTKKCPVCKEVIRNRVRSYIS